MVYSSTRRSNAADCAAKIKIFCCFQNLSVLNQKITSRLTLFSLPLCCAHRSPHPSPLLALFCFLLKGRLEFPCEWQEKNNSYSVHCSPFAWDREKEDSGEKEEGGKRVSSEKKCKEKLRRQMPWLIWQQGWNMAAAAEGFGEGERKFLHFLSTLKANFRPGRRDGRKHSCALAALPVSSTNAEQRSNINLKDWNMQSCPTTEAPSSGSISVRKQSTELAWNDELPWSTTERCWLFPGRDTCSCWQSIEVHSTFPLLQSAVFQRLWKNGWKWQDRNIHGDGRQRMRGNNLPQFIRRWRGAEVAALVVSLAKDNEHSDVYGSLFISGAVSLLCAFFALSSHNRRLFG